MTPVGPNRQPLDVLRARYAAALEYVYDVEKVVAGAIRPGECAANVFDFEDGLRLIVSRERMPDGKAVLHVSAGVLRESRMADEIRLLAVGTPPRKILSMWCADLERRFRELSGDERPLELLGWSDKMIPHFLLREDGL